MSLVGLSSYCNLNLSGVNELYYVPTAWVNQNTYERIISDAGNWQYDIEFETGDWMQLPLLPQNRSWEENEQRSAQGKYFTQRLNGIIQSVRPEVSHELAMMSEYRYLLKMLDRNARWWVLGTIDSPFDFQASAVTGDAQNGLNSYQVIFESSTPARAFGFVPVL